LDGFCARQLKAKFDFKAQVRIGRSRAFWDTKLTSFLTAATIPPEASISPTLLTRARSVAAEYAKLTAQNAESYDVAVAKKIGELGPVTTALKDWQDAQHVSYIVPILALVKTQRHTS
jgi:hypothetical protein